MTSKRFVNNATCDTAEIGNFRNIVPIKGSIYAADGLVYTKLPVGVDGDSLTSDSSTVQGLAWKPYFNTVTPMVTFHLFSCIGWSQGEIFYCSFGTNPPSGNHNVPNIISFNFDTFVIAMGLKPRASTNSGKWADNLTTLMWVGNLNFDIIGWADAANPNVVAPTIMTPATPHFTISNTTITSIYMAYYWLRPVNSPVFIPARTKFALRATFVASSLPDPDDDMYGTGNLVIRGIPN